MTGTEWLDQKAWEQKANALGRRREPFLFVVDFEGRRCRLFRRGEWEQEGLRWDFGCPVRELPVPGALAAKQRITKKEPVLFADYQRAFDIVMRGLRYGDSFLVNLTAATPIFTEMSMADIFRSARAPYRLLWPGRFVVFSPEPFVRIRSGRIFTYPMKGTRQDTGPGSSEALISDRKEQEEHATVVDLLRNDLAIVGRDVQVERYRYLELIKTSQGDIWQTSSRISAGLDAFYHERIGSILSAMLPAGSVSGAPKKRTLELIREAEKKERGWYTGICGYFDGSRLDSAVMIRYIEELDGRMVYRSGGGITARSSAGEEYREMLEKVYVPIY